MFSISARVACRATRSCWRGLRVPARPHSCGTRTALHTRLARTGLGGREPAPRPSVAEADHVIFQSAFCKFSAERFLGLLRAVGRSCTTQLTREGSFRLRTARPLTLLLGGSRYQGYPVEVALRTLALVRRERSEARLMISGAFTSRGDTSTSTSLSPRARARDAVEFTGPYTRADAPALMGRAHILLHPKVNDPCPTTVLEAMACGVPVVYSATGGTPELVGRGGVGVPGPLDWERDALPAADLAAAVRARRSPSGVAPGAERAVNASRRALGATSPELFEELFAAAR